MNYNVAENELLFAKVRPNAIIPSKREEDAGRDIYACFEEDFMVIPSYQTKLIPTGIASALNSKYYIQIEERGSTGNKGIKKSAGVIDSGYRNEWFVAISNVNSKDLIISKLTIDELIEKYGIEDCLDDDGGYYFEDDNGYAIYLNDDYTLIYPYSKAIAQAIVHEVPQVIVSEIDYNDLIKIPSERGIGQLGSSEK